jgi:hypothetical protein
MESKLFHYTSINNLALILKSKSFRFGRLDKVNDPTEGESEDSDSFAQYIFVSCWTSNSEENLALWNMYTPQMRGVRIEMPLPIFQSHKVGSNANFMVPETDCVDERKGLFILGASNNPMRIEYTDDKAKLRPRIRTDIGVKVSQLGLTKRKIWAIEDEYRYKLDIYPFDPEIKSDHFPDKYEPMLDKRTPPSIEGYLVSCHG